MDAGDVIRELKEHGKISRSGAESFAAQFHRIVTVVDEALARQDIDSAFLSSAAVHFGRTLEAAYRYSLWTALASQTVSLARGLSVRGLSGSLAGLMKTWIMAIMSAIGSPEVYELVRPLEILRGRGEEIE